MIRIKIEIELCAAPFLGCIYHFIRVDVILGEWDISDAKRAPLVAGYEELIPHPEFSYNKMDADIGLIKLNKMALFDGKIKIFRIEPSM